MTGTARGVLAFLIAGFLPACNLTYIPDQSPSDPSGGGPSGLFLPLDGAINIDTNPQFGWYAVPGATRYELQIATDPAFSAMVWDEPGIFPETTILTQATLSNFTTFYWRVYATVPGAGSPILVAGSPFQFETQGGGFTTPEAFTIQYPPFAATMIDPAVIFSWNPSAGAMSYTIEVDPSGNFSPAPIRLPNLHVNQGQLPAPLANGTLYSWRVVAIGQLGSTISNVGSFLTAP